MNNPERYLMFIDRAVLSGYRDSPNLYKIDEDTEGGKVRNIQPDATWSEVRYGYRKLDGGGVCVAAFAPDICRLPERQQVIWRSRALERPVFGQQDPSYERWLNRTLGGSWYEEKGPIRRLEEEIQLINALTGRKLGVTLFRSVQHDLLGCPAAENTEAYRKAHLELYRLINDGLDCRALEKLAKHLGVELTEPEKTLNSLKSILPDALVPVIHKPFRDCSNARNEVHGVPGQHGILPAHVKFDQDLRNMSDALTKLREWLEGVLGASAAKCLEREQCLAAVPKIVASRDAIHSHQAARRAEGKTIESVELGQERNDFPETHESEAVVFHFTDGSSMFLTIGSNAQDLSHRHENLSPEEFHASLIVTWVPGVSG